jgi:hypothetical protein
VDDFGTEHPEHASAHSLVTNFVSFCTPGPLGSCSSTDVSKATSDCGGGYVMKNCARTCAKTNGTTLCNLQRSDNSVNLCTQPFDNGGAHYQNLNEYCKHVGNVTWSNCTVVGLKESNTQQSFSDVETVTPVVNGTTTADMISDFKARATNLFGQSGYSAEAIVLDPKFSCPLGSGQSYGANLRQIASSEADVFPLCQDYAGALRHVETFAGNLVQTQFPLSLERNEEVDTIEVSGRSGKRVLKTTDYSVDRKAGVLRINAGVLAASDLGLEVHVGVNCFDIAK